MAEVLDKKEVEKEQLVDKKPKEPLFSKKNRKLITDPLNDDNPITVQVLGICWAQCTNLVSKFLSKKIVW